MKGLRGCLLTVFLGVWLVSVLSSAQSVNVTTWHNDNGRTGQNIDETTLTTSNVNQATFGKICSYALLANEQVYAQPLVLANILIGGTMHEAVYVVTMQDNIYVFDGVNHTGTSCNLLQGPFSLIPSNEAPVDCHLVSNCGAISPTVGALGTPVVDASTNTLYVVTESQFPKTNPTNFYHRLHALDLTSSTLAEKYNGPAAIPSATVGQVQFTSQNEIQRPGLLLTYEEPVPTYPTLYIGFSMMDGTSPNPSGWIFGYDAQNLTSMSFPIIYATTPGPGDSQRRHGGGIWQGGGGLAAGADSHGSNYIYFSTGDGVFDANNSGTDYGDSFVKLNTGLQATDYFAPADEYNRWDISCNMTKGGNDLDFGSGGVIVIPPDTHMNSAYQHVAIKADKENYLWVIDRTSPGKSNACIPNSCSCANTDSNVIQKVLVPTTPPHQARNTPAFWSDGTTAGPYLYFAPSYGTMSKYPLNCAPTNGPICNPTASSPPDPPDALGFAPTPSISSDGNANNNTGVVWVLTSIAKNSPLYAMDAESLNILYTSHCPRDLIGAPTKFSVPTVANGNVFVGTYTDFDIFGLTTASCN
jgi:hypothetical protein